MLDIGDIIFQSLKQEAPFNQAVSYSGRQTKIDSMVSHVNHVGIYVGQGLVIHSTPQKGVNAQGLDLFLAAANCNIVVSVNDSLLAHNAVKRVKTCVGAEYNHSFYPDSVGFYCSELITYAFKTVQGDDYFTQHPMNFHDVTTKMLLPYWQDYYLLLQQSVPQGVMGSHPQQLLRQNHLFSFIRQWA